MWIHRSHVGLITNLVVGIWLSHSLHSYALSSDGDAKVSDAAESGKARLELIRGVIKDLSITMGNADDKPPVFVTDPIMRYNDPTRELIDSTFWRLGEKGRPVAYITMELYQPKAGRSRLNSEFLALSQTPFTLKGRSLAWRPQESIVDFKKIDEVPAPATTPQRRILQMKQLARRYSAAEEYRGKHPLRLMPQPVDRYQPTDNENADAAVFLFSHGTNPEVVLFIETDGKTWSFACCRVAGAKAWVTLGDEEVWMVPAVDRFKQTDGYMVRPIYVEIPGDK